MMPNTELRLDQLILHNFRCFSECTIDLHPKLTVLVAENGRGKSAILNAIGIAFGLFVDTVLIHGKMQTSTRQTCALSNCSEK